MNRWSFSILCLLTLLPLAANAKTNQLPRTGQSTVYAAHDDGDTKGGINWPVPRFILDFRYTALPSHLRGGAWSSSLIVKQA